MPSNKRFLFIVIVSITASVFLPLECFCSSYEVKWTASIYPTLTWNLSAPPSAYIAGYLSDGTIIVCRQGADANQTAFGQVIAYDTSGTIKWQHNGGPYDAISGLPNDIQIGPDKSTTYIVQPTGTYFGNQTTFSGKLDLVALQADGKTKWTASIYPTLTWNLSAPPSAYIAGYLSDGTIIVCRQGADANQTAFGQVIAYDTSGTIKWQHNGGPYDAISGLPNDIQIGPDKSTTYIVQPTGTYFGNQTTFSGKLDLVALQADGKTKWTASIYPTLTWNLSAPPSAYIAGYLSDGTIIVCRQGADANQTAFGQVIAYDTSGTIKWQHNGGPYDAISGLPNDIQIGPDKSTTYIVQPTGTYFGNQTTFSGKLDLVALGLSSGGIQQTFTVSGSAPGGNGTLNCTSPVTYNSTSICTITPNAGYSLTTLTDNGTNVLSSVSGSSYTINNVSANHTVIAAFNPEGYPFADVPSTYWAFPYIYAIYNAHITQGYGGTNQFMPDLEMNREQMAGFIVRTKTGEPPSDYCDSGSPFSDVPITSWSCIYIKKLYDLGLTTGYGGTSEYKPSLILTREQMATIIIRALEGEPSSTYCDAGSPFTDVLPTSWSCKYIKRLYELGITTGYGGTSEYKPLLTVNRAQMATFIARAFLGVR